MRAHTERAKFDNLLNVWYIFYCVHFTFVRMKHNNRIVYCYGISRPHFWGFWALLGYVQEGIARHAFISKTIDVWESLFP